MRRPDWYAGFSYGNNNGLMGPSFLWSDKLGTILLTQHQSAYWSFYNSKENQWSDKKNIKAKTWMEKDHYVIERNWDAGRFLYLLYNNHWDIVFNYGHSSKMKIRLPLLLTDQDKVKLEDGYMKAGAIFHKDFAGFSSYLKIIRKSDEIIKFDFKLPAKLHVSSVRKIANKILFQIEVDLQNVFKHKGYSIYLN